MQHQHCQRYFNHAGGVKKRVGVAFINRSGSADFFNNAVPDCAFSQHSIQFLIKLRECCQPTLAAHNHETAISAQTEIFGVRQSDWVGQLVEQTCSGFGRVVQDFFGNLETFAAVQIGDGVSRAVFIHARDHQHMVKAVVFNVQVQPVAGLQRIGCEVVIAHALGGLEIIIFAGWEVLALEH